MKSHSSFTFILYPDWSTTKQKVYVTKNVWLPRSADITLRMESSNDQKYILCLHSQTTYSYIFGLNFNVFIVEFYFFIIFV